MQPLIHPLDSCQKSHDLKTSNIFEKMGEQAHLPNENGLQKPNEVNADNSDQEMHSDDEQNEDDLDDMSPEEFQMLDNQLDALNSALDDIEQKNDDIHAQLLVLLQSNREIRQQMQEPNPPPAPQKEEPAAQQ